jgi:cytochrome c1
MRRLALLLLLGIPGVVAATSGVDWDMLPFEPNSADKPSLQRGLNLYTNYCMGCHSLRYQRYERTADDLEIPHEILMEEIVYSDAKIGDLMENAMPEQSKHWFGAAPPDLTMVAKVRGEEWLYNYLKAFYLDESRPMGVNNKVFPNVGMPHALFELQGIQREVCAQVPKTADDGGEMRDPLVPQKAITGERCGHLEVVEGTGRYTAEEYDQAVYDIVNFLYYVAEPTRTERYRLGVYVLLFLVVLYVLTSLLGREYSKEFH